MAIHGKGPSRLYVRDSSQTMIFWKVSLIAGFLLGMLPTISESASFLDENGKDGVAEKMATQKLETNGSAGQVAAKIAGVANMDARYLATGTFQVEPRLVRNESSPIIFFPPKMDSRILKMESDTVRQTEKFWMERVLASIEEASQKIMMFHGPSALMPQKLVDDVQAKEVRVVVPVDSKPAKKERIETDVVQEGNGLKAGSKDLLEGVAVLFYERNWEFAASIARKPVFEADDVFYDLESVIISIFWRFRF